MLEKWLSIPEVEAKVPRPRERILGGDGGGVGPMREASGSEEAEEMGDGTRWLLEGWFVEDVELCSSVWCALWREAVSEDGEVATDLRRRDRWCFDSRSVFGDRDRVRCLDPCARSLLLSRSLDLSLLRGR